MDISIVHLREQCFFNEPQARICFIRPQAHVKPSVKPQAAARRGAYDTALYRPPSRSISERQALAGGYPMTREKVLATISGCSTHRSQPHTTFPVMMASCVNRRGSPVSGPNPPSPADLTHRTQPIRFSHGLQKRKFFLAALFLTLAAIVIIVPATTAGALKRVLLISSYHPAFPTFPQQAEGLRSVFQESGVLLDIEFMDSKRFFTRKSLDLFLETLAYKLGQLPPYDAILTADDNALLFAKAHFKTLFQGTPIIFFGVNNVELALEQNADPWITGVVEAVSMQETVALMVRLQPGLEKIIALVDGTPSGQADLNTFYGISDRFASLRFEDLSLATLSFEEFSARLRQLDRKNAVLLLSAYRDKTGRILQFQESLELIKKNLPGPLYHLWYHGLGQGITGGKVISHFEQARTAAEITMAVLEGKSIGTLSVQTQSPNRYVFDFNELKAHKIYLVHLPADALVLNKPTSFYYKYRMIIWATLAVVAVQTVLILFLTTTMVQRRKSEAALQESGRTLSTLLGNLPGIAYRCLNDRYWTMKFMSEGCLQLTGYHPSDFIDNLHHSYNDLIHRDDKGAVWESVQEGIDARQPFEARYRIHTASGEEKWVSEKGVGVFTDDGTLVALEGFITDVTDLVRAEAGLRRLNEELERRVADRTRELRQANRALEASLVSLEQAQAHLVESKKMAALGGLVAGVAHEINTPVGIGVTAASFLEMKTQSLAALAADHRLKKSDLEKYIKQATETSGSILKNLNRAADLIKSFKLVAVDQTAEDRRRFILKEYIDNVLLSLRPGYKRTRHTIHVTCPPELALFSYPGAFSQIISNLIMNSLIHGFEGIEAGRIEIQASTAGGKLHFRYSDNGIGMSPEVVKKIYDPFFTTKRVPDGTGLGMHIVYNLITQVLEGKINCTSTEGEGTVFSISIPLNQGTLTGDEDGT
jgi:PAS domain S-box-containing protein